MRTPDCVLDGEVCALDEDGRHCSSAMQQGRAGTSYIYVVFDVFEVDGELLVDLPLIERRKRLEGLLDRRNRVVQLSEAFEDGEALLEAAREQRFEGVVAKRADSPYRPGKRGRDWLKLKTRNTQEFVIAGYTKGQDGGRAGSARSSSLSRRTRGLSGSATAEPGSPTRRSSGYCASSGRWSAATRHS